MLETLAIPAIPCLLEDGLQAYPNRSRTYSVVYIDIVGFTRFEHLACESVAQVLHTVTLKFIPSLPWADVQMLHVLDDSLALLLQGVKLDSQHVDLVHRFVLRLEEGLNVFLDRQGLAPLRLRYGTASLVQTRAEKAGTTWYRLISQARRMALRYTDRVPLHLVEGLQQFLTTRAVRIHYQPIWNLLENSVLGWEGLARGPENSELEFPSALFETAERAGYLLDVERLCRNTAIRNARLGPEQYLFLNISPNILSDPSFRQGETRNVLSEMGLSPEQIVFEITEHHAIRDYQAFLTLVAHYKEQGYGIAMDDVGAGYSGLVTLMQVKPDFVKIDMSLIQGIDNDRTRQDIVRAIDAISQGFTGRVIAEGIETARELEMVKSLGVKYGQGFLLGRPNPEMCAGMRDST